MINNRVFIYSDRFLRCIRLYSTHREARFLDKIIKKSYFKRKRQDQIPDCTKLHSYGHITLISPESRRNTVLNDIFMQHVSDLLGYGSYAEEFSKRGIQIIEVKISANHHILFVYWNHTIEINKDEVNTLMKNAAQYLRFELTALRVIGVIPEVRFVLHREFLMQQQVEKILNYLSELKEIESTEGIVGKTSDVNVQKKREEVVLVQQPVFDIPEMNYKTLGLDRFSIYKDILARKEASEKAKNKVYVPVPRETTDKKLMEPIEFCKRDLAKILLREKRRLQNELKLRQKFLESNSDDLDESQENFNEMIIDEEENEEGWETDTDWDDEDHDGSSR